MQGLVGFSPWGVRTSSTRPATTSAMTASGARLDGGGMTAPGVPSSLGSYWSFSAATVDLQASVVKLGPLPASMFPVALATPLIAWAAAYSAAIITVVNAVAAATVPSTDGGKAALTALGVALAVPGALPPIPDGGCVDVDELELISTVERKGSLMGVTENVSLRRFLAFRRLKSIPRAEGGAKAKRGRPDGKAARSCGISGDTRDEAATLLHVPCGTAEALETVFDPDVRDVPQKLKTAARHRSLG